MTRFSSPRRKIEAKIERLLAAIASGWLALFLAGCTVGPDYQKPTVSAPPAFRSESVVSTNSFADLPWWQIFQDENLQGLIRTALTNNYDLQIALTRLEQA